jgi:hypothetical protein
MCMLAFGRCYMSWSNSIHACELAYAYIHACMHIHMYTRIRTCTHAYIHIYIHTFPGSFWAAFLPPNGCFLYIYIYVCMYVCMYVYIYIHTHTKCIHIRIQFRISRAFLGRFSTSQWLFYIRPLYTWQCITQTLCTSSGSIRYVCMCANVSVHNLVCLRT